MTVYSASEEDLEAVCYFLLFQQMGELPRRSTYAMTDLLDVRQDAQFESE